MTVNLHGISRESFDLIVDEEVSGQAAYEKKYVHPEKPGGQSGVTVGIGYDCGYSSAATIRSDWAGKIPQPMIDALASCAGIKGDAAFSACNRVHAIVAVPWEAAIEVFSEVSIPKYMASTRKGLPGYDNLSPDCKGALLSLVYNRGASFTLPGDRYSEMRAIRAAMVSGNLAAIPGEFRKMKRLWTAKSVRGVALRREHEAKLFERGLAAHPDSLLSQAAADAPEANQDEDETAPFPTNEPADRDPAIMASTAPDDGDKVEGNYVLFSVQKRLKAMNYNPGTVKGVWGGMTAGAISGFLNDRQSAVVAPTSLAMFETAKVDIVSELLRAEAEGFLRPVSAARANADPGTVAAVAPEVVPAKRSFLAMVWASIVAAAGAIWNTVSGWVSQAWDFFTDHKDDLPSDSTSYLGTAWEYIQHIPTPVWCMAAAGLFVFLALDARKGVQKITESVQTGARQ